MDRELLVVKWGPDCIALVSGKELNRIKKEVSCKFFEIHYQEDMSQYDFLKPYVDYYVKEWSTIVMDIEDVCEKRWKKENNDDKGC